MLEIVENVDDSIDAPDLRSIHPLISWFISLILFQTNRSPFLIFPLSFKISTLPDRKKNFDRN